MESNQLNSLNNFLDKRQGQDTEFKVQLIKVYNAFKVKSMTMLEADKFTGVMRSNICWYIKNLMDQDRIAVISKRKCSITGHLVNEYTTNTDLFPKSNQLSLF